MCSGAPWRVSWVFTVKIKVNGLPRRHTVLPSQSSGNSSALLPSSRSRTPVRHSHPLRLFNSLTFRCSTTGGRREPRVYRCCYEARTAREDSSYIGRQVHSSPFDHGNLSSCTCPPSPAHRCLGYTPICRHPCDMQTYGGCVFG